MNDKQGAVVKCGIAICEKRDLLNRIFCNKLIDLDDTCSDEMVNFYWKCYKAGWDIADADCYAQLNTLFDYDIGMTHADGISKTLYERDLDPMELGAKDQNTLTEICRELEIDVDFDRWIQEEPECMVYWNQERRKNMAAGFEASLIKQFNHCNAIAADILDNNKSKEIQEYAKKFAEIESPLVGGTEAEWIRINWGDIYIFLCDDGNIRYQVDPLGEYGGELIDMWNCEMEDFIKAILSLEEPPIIRDGVTIYESADPIEEPDLYVPMKQRKNISPTKNRLRERALR